MRDVWAEEYEPGNVVQTDEDWKKYALANTLSIYHLIGTCAMLPERDGGVVDAELKVYGIKDLRVVDASVILLLPSAHLQTLVYRIAERAAGLIVKGHQGY
jgi:choline dehydrogenase-like flavoprotein